MGSVVLNEGQSRKFQQFLNANYHLSLGAGVATYWMGAPGTSPIMVEILGKFSDGEVAELAVEAGLKPLKQLPDKSWEGV